MAEDGEVAIQENHVESAEAPAQAVTAEGAAADPVDEDPEARYRYDDALLVKVKGKVRRPAKPDEELRNATVVALKGEIEARSARIKEIKELQENSRAARSNSQHSNQDTIRHLQVLRNEFQTVLRQKEHTREELMSAGRTREELRKASRAVRERLPRGVTADNLETRLQELEYQLQYDPGSDEKGVFKRLQELQQARPLVREAADIDARLKAIEDARAGVQARLASLDVQLNDIKARETAHRSVLDEARSKAAETELDIPALNVEKKESWDIIQALRAKINEVRDEFNAQYKEYIKLDRNYNNYMRHVKRQEYLERQKVRAERDAADAAEQNGELVSGSTPSAEAPVSEAYAAEVFTLDQLLTYLRKLVPADVQASAAAEDKKQMEVPKGMKLLKKGEDEVFMTVAKKKPTGKKGAVIAEPTPTATSRAPAEPAKKKLNHSLETLKTFMTFSIVVPQTSAELPGTLEKVEAKKEYYLELRRTGRKHQPERPVVTAAASAAEPAPEAVTGATAAAAEPGSVSPEAADPTVVEPVGQAAVESAAELPAEASETSVDTPAQALADTAAVDTKAAPGSAEPAPEESAVASAETHAVEALADQVPHEAEQEDLQEDLPAAVEAPDHSGTNGIVHSEDGLAADEAAPNKLANLGITLGVSDDAESVTVTLNLD